MDNPKDQNQTPEQKELEKQVQRIMGPLPLDPNKQEPIKNDDENKEKILVIPNNNGSQAKTDAPALTSEKPFDFANLANGPRPEEIIRPSMPAATGINTDMSDIKKEPEAQPKPLKSGGKLRRFLRKWFSSSRNRWITFAAVVVIILGLILTPASRYFVLNAVGVRSSASLTVVDEATELPLKNVDVQLAGVSGQTDENGHVKLSKIKLGGTNLIITKRAFAIRTESVTVGWGSNPLGNFGLTAVGERYSFVVSDWLSGKAIQKAEADTDQSSAISDENGKISLAIDPADVKDNASVTIKAAGYRDEKLTLDPSAKTDQKVAMVLARKEVFISNRDGKYNLYTSDLDGKNEKLVLAATGIERDDMILVPHPSAEVAALVSTRVNIRNADGFLLSTLTLVNLEDSSTFPVAQSEKIQIIGWVGDRLVFVQIAAGASATDPGRFRLMSYNYKTAEKIEIAKANYFNDVILIGSSLYYAPSSAYQSDPSVGLIKSNADGTQKQTVLNLEVWNIFRVSFDTLDLSVVNQKWYEYKLNTSNPVKLNESPANPKSRIYVNNIDNTHSLWSEERDGKGVLIDYDQKTGKETVLQTKGGLGYPIRWVSNSAFIYRLDTDQETADYVMSLDGGTAHKIKDVYNSGGIDRWYYY